MPFFFGMAGLGLLDHPLLTLGFIVGLPTTIKKLHLDFNKQRQFVYKQDVVVE